MHIDNDHPQELLRQSEDRFSLLFRKSPVATSITSIDTGRFVAVNEAWSAMFGYAPDEVGERTAFELDLWVSADNRCEMLRMLRADGSVQDQHAELRHRSGEIFDAVISAETIELNGGQYLLALVQNATESRRANEALERCEKRYHALAHGMAHDFNNLLAMILGCAELITLQTHGNPKIQKYLDRIIDAAQRGKSITQRLTASNGSCSTDPSAEESPCSAAAVETDQG